MIRLFFFKNYFSDNWNKIDFVIVVGSVIDVVLDLLKVFHFSCVFFRFNVIFCLPSSLQQHCFRFKASTFERLEQKKKIIKNFSFLVMFYLYFYLHCYLMSQHYSLAFQIQGINFRVFRAARTAKILKKFTSLRFLLWSFYLSMKVLSLLLNPHSRHFQIIYCYSFTQETSVKAFCLINKRHHLYS